MPLILRAALVFASATLLGLYLPAPPSLALPLLPVALLLHMLPGRSEARVLLGCMLTAVALALMSAHEQRVACWNLRDGQRIRVRAVMESLPAAGQHAFSIRLLELNGRACKAALRASVRGKRLPEGGAEFEARGTWLSAVVGSGLPRPGGGVLLLDSLAPSHSQSAHPLLRARAAAQQRLRVLFPQTSGLAESLLIAQRDGLDDEVRARFAASGLTHLLAISGTHVALVAGVLWLFARLLRVNRKVAAIMCIAGTTSYVFFLGAPYAALRALLQLLLVMCARGMQRPAHPLGLIGGAAIILLAWQPVAIADAGFQLSFAGIIGIVLWRRRLMELLPSTLPTMLRDAIGSTTAATIVTTPIAAFHFGMVSVISLFANMLAIPIVSLAVPACAAALFVALVSESAAAFLAAGAELSLLWLDRTARMCAAVPGGHFAATPPQVAAWTCAAIVAAYLLRRRWRKTRKKVVYAVAVGASVVVLTSWPLLTGQSGSGELQVHMIDVGQGDAFAIRTPARRWLLVDAGPASATYDAGASRVVPFLLRHGASRIEAMILTHPHLDHYGGAAAVHQRVPIRAILDPVVPAAAAKFNEFVQAAERTQVVWYAARAGRIMSIDGLRLEFLHPDTVSVDASSDPNDLSAAFRLSYGEFSALFLGDLSTSVEDAIAARYDVDVDVLKVAHHGSRTSTSVGFVGASTPAVALISAGRRNRFGHPAAEVVNRLEAAGVQVFRTDRQGTVSLSARADGSMRVRTGQ